MGTFQVSANRGTAGDVQQGRLGIKHREGPPDRDLRRSHDRPRTLQVAFKSGKPSAYTMEASLLGLMLPV